MSDTSDAPTQTDDSLEVRMERVLPATPEEVFDAYTDADQQKVWFGILDAEPGVVEIEVDLRVGGTQTAVWGPDADSLFREVQTFLEIDRPHRLRTESVGSTPDGMEMTTQIEVRFEPVGADATRMLVRQWGFPTPEIRDFFQTMAWIGALDRIEAYLRSRA